MRSHNDKWKSYKSGIAQRCISFGLGFSSVVISCIQLPSLPGSSGGGGREQWALVLVQQGFLCSVSGWSTATVVSMAELKYSYQDHQSGRWLLSWKTAKLPWIVCGFGCCSQVVSCACFQAFASVKVLAKSMWLLDNYNFLSRPTKAVAGVSPFDITMMKRQSYRRDEAWHLECSPWSIYPWCSTRQLHFLPDTHFSVNEVIAAEIHS